MKPPSPPRNHYNHIGIRADPLPPPHQVKYKVLTHILISRYENEMVIYIFQTKPGIESQLKGPKSSSRH